MSNAKLKLKSPPIIEAVLDIDCDLPLNFRVSNLEIPGKKAFAKNYPNFRPQYVQKHEIRMQPNVPPEVLAKDIGIQALQFLKNGEKQLVQFRTQGFSFNRLTPYSSLDEYLPQIKSAWSSYVKIASPIQIRQIRLRYINRIVLPLVNGDIDLDFYFQKGPRVADESKFKFLGFLNQYSAVDVVTGYQVVSLLTAQAAEGDKLPVIFDNTAVCGESAEPTDWAWISSKIRGLRELKNHVFRKTLTEECLNLFQ